MKVAVCLFGYPNFYELGIKSLNNFLDGIDYDLYMHSWCKNDTSDQYYQTLFNSINNIYKPKKFILDRQIDFRRDFDFPVDLSEIKHQNDIGAMISDTISTIYSIKKVGEILEEVGNSYDLVIFSRTDCFCSEKLINYNFKDFDTIYSSFCTGDIWDLNKNGIAIDAKLIMSNYENMIFFSKLYNKIDDYLKLGVKLGHHTMFVYHFKKISNKFKMVFGSENWYLIRPNGFLSNERNDSEINNYSDIFLRSI